MTFPCQTNLSHEFEVFNTSKSSHSFIYSSFYIPKISFLLIETCLCYRLVNARAADVIDLNGHMACELSRLVTRAYLTLKHVGNPHSGHVESPLYLTTLLKKINRMLH